MLESVEYSILVRPSDPSLNESICESFDPPPYCWGCVVQLVLSTFVYGAMPRDSGSIPESTRYFFIHSLSENIHSMLVPLTGVPSDSSSSALTGPRPFPQEDPGAYAVNPSGRPVSYIGLEQSFLPSWKQATFPSQRSHSFPPRSMASVIQSQQHRTFPPMFVAFITSCWIIQSFSLFPWTKTKASSSLPCVVLYKTLKKCSFSARVQGTSIPGCSFRRAKFCGLMTYGSAGMRKQASSPITVSLKVSGFRQSWPSQEGTFAPKNGQEALVGSLAIRSSFTRQLWPLQARFLHLSSLLAASRFRRQSPLVFRYFAMKVSQKSQCSAILSLQSHFSATADIEPAKQS